MYTHTHTHAQACTQTRKQRSIVHRKFDTRTQTQHIHTHTIHTHTHIHAHTHTPYTIQTNQHVYIISNVAKFKGWGKWPAPLNHWPTPLVQACSFRAWKTHPLTIAHPAHLPAQDGPHADRLSASRSSEPVACPLGIAASLKRSPSAVPRRLLFSSPYF